jgi:hypothetical protein
MLTHIITLEDGVRIEAVNVSADVSVPSSEAAAMIGSMTPLLRKIVDPIAAAWKDLSESVVIDSAEVEVGIGIESTGNFFVVGAKGNVNFRVKFTLKQK